MSDAAHGAPFILTFDPPCDAINLHQLSHERHTIREITNLLPGLRLLDGGEQFDAQLRKVDPRDGHVSLGPSINCYTVSFIFVW